MKFLGTGSALPKKVVSNDDLAQVMDTSDEWIRSRTGIGMRHIAVEETTTSMAVEAAEKALADAKISGCEIDLIIAGTISPDYIFPSLACEVQAAIGAKSATAFDLKGGVCHQSIFDDDDFITVPLCCSEPVQVCAIRALERIVDVIIPYNLQCMNLFHGIEGILDVFNTFLSIYNPCLVEVHVVC